MPNKFRFSAAALSIVAVLAMLFAGPAYANHDADHQKGDSTSTSETDGRRDCEQNDKGSGGYYDAKCYPEESENGSKTGDGSGKPCAGCVGKADNKNPPGQSPDENDSNKGYECDDNHGVGAQRGSGNPAHTGCRTDSSTPEEPCDADKNMAGIQECDEEEVCDADKNMAGIQKCESGGGGGGKVCDADSTMAGIQKCEEVEGERVCDADPTMSGVQECEKPVCPEDGSMVDATAEDCVPVCPEDVTMGDAEADECLPPCPEDAVMGEVAAEECAEDAVLGVRSRGVPRTAPAVSPAITRGARPRGQVLPFTGAAVSTWLIAGLLLVALGWLLSRPGYLTKSH